MGWKKFDDLPSALQHRIEQAIVAGGNDTLAESVIQAKGNHPGWENRTGAAEGSIAMRGMKAVGNGHYKGRFGSYGIAYFIWLEIGTQAHAADHTIRRAADKVFPSVWNAIRRHL